MTGLGMTAAYLNRARAKVERLCAAGKTVTLNRVDEATDQDDYGEIVSETQLELKAWPVRYAPFSRKITSSVEWAAEVDVIAYVSKKAVDDKGLDIDDIRAHGIMDIDGKRFGVRQVGPHMNVRDDHLYYLIGGAKDGAPG